MPSVKEILNSFKNYQLRRQDRNAEILMELWRDETYRTYPVKTGAARRSITPVRKVGPMQYTFEVTVPYAGVIEYGGYRGEGPKAHLHGPEALSPGVTIERGIYTTPEAPMRRAQVKVLKRLPALVEGDRDTGAVTGRTLR